MQIGIRHFSPDTLEWLRRAYRDGGLARELCERGQHRAGGVQQPATDPAGGESAEAGLECTEDGVRTHRRGLVREAWRAAGSGACFHRGRARLVLSSGGRGRASWAARCRRYSRIGPGRRRHAGCCRIRERPCSMSCNPISRPRRSAAADRSWRWRPRTPPRATAAA